MTVTNARGKTRTYAYTLRGEVNQLTQPDGAVENWVFDANGNVATYINALGQSIGFSYSVAGDPTLVNYPTGVDTAFFYDSRTRFDRMTDATGTTQWAYNLVGQVTSLTTPQGTFGYTYNSLGQPYQMTDASGTWTTGYDQYHRAVSLTNPWSETTTVQFDTAGRVDRKNLPNGMYETYLYDNRSRLTEIKTYGTGDVLRDTKSYGWDAASRVLSAVEGGVETLYGYDAIDQLTSETKAALNYAGSYTYDANGNRLTRTVNGVQELYTYDDADKLTSITGGGDPRTFTYDLAGRTKTIVRPSGTTTLNYDYSGKTTSISYQGGGTDTYTYNGSGARVAATGVSGTKTYRREGANVSSPVLSDGTTNYTPGSSTRVNSVTTNQHSGLKNTMDQTDANQSVTASRHYDAFGNVIASSGQWSGQFGYGGTSGYQEDGSGLKLLGHRIYDPGIGRFLTQDPIGDGKNWYGYVGNNPIAAADPLGLKTVVIIVGHGNADEPELPGRFKTTAEALASLFREYGDTVIILYAPTQDEAAPYVAMADAIVYIGHGSTAGGAVRQRNGRRWSLTPQWVSKVRQGKKLVFALLMTCNSMNDPASVRAWEMLGPVFGVQGSLSVLSDFLRDWSAWRKGFPVTGVPRRSGFGPRVRPSDLVPGYQWDYRQ